MHPLTIPAAAGISALAFVTHVVSENFTPAATDKSYLTTNDDDEIVVFSLESFHAQIDSAIASALEESKSYTDTTMKVVTDALQTKSFFVSGKNSKFSGTNFPHSENNQNWISGTTHVHDVRFGNIQLTETVLQCMLQPCTVWENDFHGHWIPFTHGDWDENELNKRHMNNRITSLWTGSFKVRLYEGKDFTGRNVFYGPQRWITHNAIKNRRMNDCVSSIRVRFPWEKL
mgnify:CR=1 FL=1|tara:strand:+ start:5521 stop:6210 length:690 start_codon:yes stop_codon:yes gene_type:complete